jgi:hypothetical protein
MDLTNKNNNLLSLKNKIDKLGEPHHIKIGSILKQHSQTLNTNGNTILVNLSNIPDTVIDEINKYVNFVCEQEAELVEIEKISNQLKQKIIKQDE